MLITTFMLRSRPMTLLAAAVVAALATDTGCGADAEDGSKCRSAAQMAAPSACDPAGTGGSGGSGMPAVVNGCDSGMAIDKTDDASTTISFAGIEYTPSCVRVRAGSTVFFAGNFESHPLVGGTVNGATATPDSSSQLPATSSGSEIMVTLSKAGAVPYYCTAHVGSGMMGAIFVE